VELHRIEKRWTGRCIVAAPGQSLTPTVADACRGEHVIAVNDAYRLLPWADVLYACDGVWWEVRDGCPDFAGEKWSSHGLDPANDKIAVAERYQLSLVAGEHRPGFSIDPGVIHYGSNSGFQAVNFAYLWGAEEVVLVGFDMHGEHFFGNHATPLRTGDAPFALFIAAFEEAARMMPPGFRILNATPGSALTCFEMVDLGAVVSAPIPPSTRRRKARAAA
jgi:hypothetical protein